MIGGDLRHVVLSLPAFLVWLMGAGAVGGMVGYWFAIGWTRLMRWLMGSSLHRPP